MKLIPLALEMILVAIDSFLQETNSIRIRYKNYK